MRSALDRLSTAAEATSVDAVAVGSPHFSLSEFGELVRLVRGRTFSVPFWVCTARETWREACDRGDDTVLRQAGVEVVVDTCVVVTPILAPGGRVLMTNSGKFAHYGPSNTGYDVVYGSLADCVDSAVTGEIRRDESSWSW